MKNLCLLGLIAFGSMSLIGCSSNNSAATQAQQAQQIAMLRGCLLSASCTAGAQQQAAAAGITVNPTTGQVLQNGVPVASGSAITVAEPNTTGVGTTPTSITLNQATARLTAASARLASDPESANDSVGVVHTRAVVTDVPSEAASAPVSSSGASAASVSAASSESDAGAAASY
jgi:hypothetical protein